MAKSALVFLNGYYDFDKLDFYRKQIEQAGKNVCVVAVDGGLQFLDGLSVRPDLLVGDFDSISPELLSKYADCKRLVFEKAKDFTDGELALRACLDRGFDKIIVFGGLDGSFETDHLFGNVFSLFLAKRLAAEKGIENFRISMHDPGQEIHAVEDETLPLDGSRDDMVSIIPLDKKVTVGYDGFAYPLDGRREIEVCFGESVALRNETISERAKVRIGGRAILVRHT